MTSVFIIGASGAIGLELVAAITAERGPRSVIAALHHTPLPPHLAETTVCEFGVDVQDQASLQRALEKHADKIDTVWNLAAPLSVATAQNPALAHDITVNGMQRLLEAMRSVGLKKICFSDSIGSFGAEAPRTDASAAWLCSHPTQDPGSDYGRQKRACRELLREYSEQHGFDTRWAVIPGVLHSKRTWGGGTTEYALDALMAAARHTPYICPLPLDTMLPMIHVADLVSGLIALMNTPRASLLEPEGGYTLAGFSFTPKDLFSTINELAPALNFSYTIDLTRNPHAQHFAALWPDTISPTAAARDLAFLSRMDMRATVSAILTAFCAYAAEWSEVV
eukprot:m.8701 g.8701  ORF g.8701 m.8701 type:complete len:337 (+) comp5270_c0_seq1:123-1133(+)